jgi:lipopolysaccharide export system protein LptC
MKHTPMQRMLMFLGLYLPLIIMSVLAALTFWLVRQAPPPLPLLARGPVRHQQDYFMHKFSLQSFDRGGQLRTLLEGENLRHFPDTDIAEIDSIRLRSQDKRGQVSTARATRGLVNGDASEAQLLGQASVIKEKHQPSNNRAPERLSYEGEFLHLFLLDQRLKSHLPVKFTRGQDVFQADSLAFDHLEQTAALQGRVRAVIAAKTGPKTAPAAAPKASSSQRRTPP